MEKLIIWSLAAYGLTNILVAGSIFDKPRHKIQSIFPRAGAVLDCFMCTGFHVGWILWYPLSISYDYTSWYFSIPIDCFAASAIAWIMNQIVTIIQSAAQLSSTISNKIESELYDSSDSIE